MNKRIKKLKLGALISLPVVALPLVVSMTNLYKDNEVKRSEYISIVLDNKEMTFKNTEKAVDYIIRNKINVDQKVMVGEPQYLDKNKGILNPDSLTEYIGDKDHVAPAYKMMNGEYTMDRNKAIKSFLGRSHLVSQYYDNNGKYFEGNVAGLQKAKDNILSKQKEGVVPYYDVDLGAESVNINPFNGKDVAKLKTKVRDLYTKGVDTKGKLSQMYLLPGENGSKVGVILKDPSKGLQLSDLAKPVKSLKERIEERIRFKFSVRMDMHTISTSPSQSNSNPYRFVVPKGYSEKEYIEIKDWSGAQIKFSEDHKSFDIKNITYKVLKDHESDFNTFLSHNKFWEKYEEKSMGKLYKWYCYPKPKTDKHIFNNISLEIKNINDSLSWKKTGYDVSLNSSSGTFYQFSTYSELTIAPSSLPNTKEKEDWRTWDKKGYNNMFLQGIKLSEDVKNNLIEEHTKHELNVYWGAIKQRLEKFHFKVETINGYTDCKFEDTWKGGEQKLIQTQWPKDKTSLEKDSILLPLKNCYPNNKLNKILLLNNSPIEELCLGEPKKIKKDSEIIKNIKTEYRDGKFYYTYRNKWKDTNTNTEYNSYWEYATRNFNNSQDFIKKNSFAGNKQIELFPNSWVQFRKNSLYDERENGTSQLKRIPWLLASKQNGGYASIKLAKILVGKTNEVYSIYKKDPSELFMNDVQISKRKEQISKDFFEPQLVYVIYNDNDEIIAEFASGDSSLKFDDKETVKHNARAVLSKYLKKDVYKVFVKDSNNKWTHKPMSNKLKMVYNLHWNGQLYLFESFEQIKSFITEWVQINSRKIVIE